MGRGPRDGESEPGAVCQVGVPAHRRWGSWDRAGAEAAEATALPEGRAASFQGLGSRVGGWARAQARGIAGVAPSWSGWPLLPSMGWALLSGKETLGMRDTLAASRPRTQPSCLDLPQGQRAGARAGPGGSEALRLPTDRPHSQAQASALLAGPAQLLLPIPRPFPHL